MKRGFLLLSFISFYYYNLKIVICNLGLPLCSVGKESTCNAGYLGSTPELGRSPGEDPTPAFWPEEFHALLSPWGRKELGTTERLTLSLSELK